MASLVTDDLALAEDLLRKIELHLVREHSSFGHDPI